MNYKFCIGMWASIIQSSLFILGAPTLVNAFAAVMWMAIALMFLVFDITRK